MRSSRQAVFCGVLFFLTACACGAQEAEEMPEIKMFQSGAPQETGAAQNSQDVEVIHVSGDVEVCDAEGANCQKPEEGMMLEAGSKIRTKSEATLELGFDEDQKNVVRVEAESDAAVSLSGDEKMILENGEVFAAIKELPAGSSFEIKTPTVVSGARGTEWATKVDSEGTVVEAFDDNPFVKTLGEDGKPKGEEVKVLTGHMTTVKRFQPPAPLVKIPEMRRERWQAMRGEVKQHVERAKARERLPQEMRKRGPMNAQQKERFEQRMKAAPGRGPRMKEGGPRPGGQERRPQRMIDSRPGAEGPQGPRKMQEKEGPQKIRSAEGPRGILPEARERKSQGGRPEAGVKPPRADKGPDKQGAPQGGLQRQGTQGQRGVSQNQGGGKQQMVLTPRPRSAAPAKR